VYIHVSYTLVFPRLSILLRSCQDLARILSGSCQDLAKIMSRSYKNLGKMFNLGWIKEEALFSIITYSGSKLLHLLSCSLEKTWDKNFLQI